jgi:hypothetical protein
MNTEAILVVRSITHASKGKQLLSSANINSRVVKPESSGGCLYGIAVSRNLLASASDILEKNGIEIKEIIHR